jgi:hypothetical protein
MYCNCRFFFLTLPISDVLEDIESGASAEYATRAEVGTVEYLIELEQRRSIKVN